MIRSKSARKPALPLELSPTLEFERSAGFPRLKVVGIDEVGRGCLAGPVVAAAVWLPEAWDLPFKKLVKQHPEIAHITDSKKMSADLRAEIAPWIRANVGGFGIGFATVEEIDRINIYHASHLAMFRAAEALGDFDHALIDGNVVPKGWAKPAQPIVKGDLRALSIACASIIAKVYRDEWMGRYAEEHPGFGFEVHKGYGTPKHLSALRERGACAIHRRSFAPVRIVLGIEVATTVEQSLNLFPQDDETENFDDTKISAEISSKPA